MRRRMAALAGIAVMLVAVAGCGQEDGGPDVASANNGKAESAAKKEPKGDPEKFSKCLRENGVKVEEFRADKSGSGEVAGGAAIRVDGGSPGGDKTFEKAHEKCKKYAPVGDGAMKLSEKDKEEMLKHARCMRKEGVDIPDPTFDGKADRAQPIPGDLKKFEAALKKCGGANGSAVVGRAEAPK